MPENIGAAGKEEIEGFAAYVLGALGHEGFELRWTTSGCILIPPIVYIHEHYVGTVRWKAKEMVLHEIAHISTWPADDRHGNLFYRRYVELVGRFMLGEEIM